MISSPTEAARIAAGLGSRGLALKTVSARTDHRVLGTVVERKEIVNSIAN